MISMVANMGVVKIMKSDHSCIVVVIQEISPSLFISILLILRMLIIIDEYHFIIKKYSRHSLTTHFHLRLHLVTSHRMVEQSSCL